MKVYDLFCGLGGWADGFLAEGYEVVGFDIEAHEYRVPDNPEAGDGSKGTRPVAKRGWTQGCAVSLGLEGATQRPATKLLKYPGKLILRDIRSIHGSELKDATCIVASPPCQAYSYRAMPWKRAKALPPPDNTLFNECFRIQREASEAAGRYIPMVVENVRGAQKWVGRAQWNYGSFYLWGDVPALMPMTMRREIKAWHPGRSYRNGHKSTAHLTNPGEHGQKNNGGSWFNVAHNTTSGKGRNPVHELMERGVKGFTPNGEPLGKNTLGRKYGSKSSKRKAASAMIAKIPFPLAQHIARCFKQASEDAA